MLRTLLIFVAVGGLLATVGCAADPGTPATSPSAVPDSGVEGRVLSAGGPVVANASPRPYAATEIAVLDDAGTLVARVTPHTDGRFVVALTPGSYTLDARPTSGNPWFNPEIVEVRPGGFTSVVIYAQMR